MSQRLPDAFAQTQGPGMSKIDAVFHRMTAGFIVTRRANGDGEGFGFWIVLETGGAVIGWYGLTAFGAAAVTKFDLYRVLVTVAGSVTVLILYHAVIDRHRAY